MLEPANRMKIFLEYLYGYRLPEPLEIEAFKIAVKYSHKYNAKTLLKKCLNRLSPDWNDKIELAHYGLLDLILEIDALWLAPVPLYCLTMLDEDRRKNMSLEKIYDEVCANLASPVSMCEAQLYQSLKLMKLKSTKKLCVSCYLQWNKVIYQYWEHLWAKLPELFGLGSSWDELVEMKPED
ncbi:hypothetical protein M422DRAFT_36141 [Sphaerobolus stellatus SS14]|uniref:Unplaced genomic scaffold SPHSTscaffold_163, whole genome shotgun sequence n=1 Tax=Sphaerobolus stellatus (strain SS14) TaxID=990650 RepID=A0A0C9V2C5_SPHS4|nr:hypothetical protein M422DRAFT_36141 [Sphaerobolus stellatus SS14]